MPHPALHRGILRGILRDTLHTLHPDLRAGLLPQRPAHAGDVGRQFCAPAVAAARGAASTPRPTVTRGFRFQGRTQGTTSALAPRVLRASNGRAVVGMPMTPSAGTLLRCMP